MFKLRREHMEAFRPVARAQTPHCTLADLHKRGVNAERDFRHGDIVARDARGFKTVLSFRADGLPARLVQPSGATHYFDHDSQGQLEAVTYPGGDRIEITRDSKSNVTNLRRPGLLAYRLEYDSENRPTCVHYPGGAKTRISYHPSGPAESLVDRTGATTYFERDRDGRLLAVVDPLGRRTIYEVDDEQRLESIVFPDGTRQEYGFDDQSNRGFIRRRDGSRICLDVDDSDRLRGINWDDGSKTSLNFEGAHLVAATNQNGSCRFDFDDSGRVTLEESPNGTISYTYDADGRILRLKASDSEPIEYGYDEDGRLTRIFAWGNREIRIHYAPDGSISELQFADSLIERREHARVGRIARAVVTDQKKRLIGEQSYGYDDNERLTGARIRWKDNLTPLFSRRIEYDAEGRVLAEIETDNGLPLASYSYDSKGNLVEVDGTPIALDAMDAPVRLGNASIEYDRLGNVRRMPGPRGEIRCRFSADGTMAEAATASGIVHFKYDAFGRRIEKIAGSTTWRYGWTGYQLLWEEVQEGFGRPIRRDYLYLAGTSLPLAFHEKGQTFWLQTDARGAVIGAYDESGVIVWRAIYDSFGRILFQSGTVRQSLRLAGQYEDVETGLYYNVSRYYAPWSRSYMSQDPHWQHRAATNYSLCCNDPWNRADPRGGLPELLDGVISTAKSISSSVQETVTDPGFWRQAGEYAVTGAVVVGSVAIGVAAAPAVAAVGVTGAAATALTIAISATGTVALTYGGEIVKQKIRGDPICFKCALAPSAEAGFLDALLNVITRGASKLVPAPIKKAAADAFAKAGELIKKGFSRASSALDDAARSEPAWLRRIKEGIEFNRVRKDAYPYNEVYIEKPGGVGYYRLDSYDPELGRIVSRKYTQLADVKPETAIKYVEELPKKYPRDAVVANVPSSKELAGQRLSGDMILEVPVQSRPVPPEVIEAANKNKVIIMDTEGRIYNP